MVKLTIYELKEVRTMIFSSLENAREYIKDQTIRFGKPKYSRYKIEYLHVEYNEKKLLEKIAESYGKKICKFVVRPTVVGEIELDYKQSFDVDKQKVGVEIKKGAMGVTFKLIYLLYGKEENMRDQAQRILNTKKPIVFSW